MGKGSGQRPTDLKAYTEGWERVYGSKSSQGSPDKPSPQSKRPEGNTES